MPKHSETRILPYTPEQMFDLVADIERYPEFLPWCLGARIKQRQSDMVVADLIIGFKMVREKFTSRVVLDRPGEIQVDYIEGPLRYLHNYWGFREHPEGVAVDYAIDFEFRSKVLQSLIGSLFHQAYKRMVQAFEARAHALYGEDGKTAVKPKRTSGAAARLLKTPGGGSD